MSQSDDRRCGSSPGLRKTKTSHYLWDVNNTDFINGPCRNVKRQRTQSCPAVKIWEEHKWPELMPWSLEYCKRIKMNKWKANSPGGLKLHTYCCSTIPCFGSEFDLLCPTRCPTPSEHCPVIWRLHKELFLSSAAYLEAGPVIAQCCIRGWCPAGDACVFDILTANSDPSEQAQRLIRTPYQSVQRVQTQITRRRG